MTVCGQYKQAVQLAVQLVRMVCSRQRSSTAEAADGVRFDLLCSNTLGDWRQFSSSAGLYSKLADGSSTADSTSAGLMGCVSRSSSPDRHDRQYR